MTDDERKAQEAARHDEDRLRKESARNLDRKAEKLNNALAAEDARLAALPVWPRRDWLKSALIVVAILALGDLCWLAGEAAWSARVGREKAGRLIENANAAAVELKQAAARFNEPTRVKSIDDYLISQAGAALATSNNTRKVANNLNNLIREDLRPLVQDLRPRLNDQLETTTALTAELKHQIAQNGDAAKALLEEGRVLVADSREQVVDILKELNATSRGLQVLVNDPDLAKMIDNLNSTTESAAGTGKHIEVITGDLEGLSARYLRPLYQPKKRGFFGSLGNGVLTVFRYVTGASNVIYLISRF